MLETARTHHPIARKRGVEIWLRHCARELGLTIAEGPAIGPAVEARVNHGRWLVDCPDCPGAELVDPDEPVFYCLSCGNRGIGGQLRRVRFPPQRRRIEEVLLRRPRENRNWRPSELTADLLRENTEHDVR